VQKNDVIFPEQWYLKRIGKNQNDLRKDQRREEQSSPMMGRYSDKEVSTISKGIEGD